MKIKICGIKTLEAANAAIDAGASHIGFVLFRKSPRNISARDASALVNKIRVRNIMNLSENASDEEKKDKVKTVIVTVNPADELISETLLYFKPDYIQLHGSESPARIKEIKTKFDLKVIKALPINTKNDLKVVDKYKKYVDYILFDAMAHPGAESPGGNATSFEWGLLKDFKPDYNWILSGGLTPKNVEEAIKVTNAPFVDVSSGVESKPGNKDVELIKSFINNAKIADKKR